MILLAQISDTHFDLTPRNAERVATVLGYLERLPRRPDAVLVTGDVTDSGTLAQYEQARKVLSTDLPLYAPGNHDDRAIAGDDRIIGVLAGHMHAMVTTLFGGRPLVVAPSVASAIGGAWEVGAPGEVPIDYAPDPSVVLHAVEDGRLTTLVRTVPMGGRISVQPC